MNQIKFSENKIKIGDTEIICQSPVLQIIHLQDKIITLLDPTVKNKERFRNLMAYDLTGNQIWIANLPTDEEEKKWWVYKETGSSFPDAYVKIFKKRKILYPWSFSLFANSWSSFECEINISNGKILTANFFK